MWSNRRSNNCLLFIMALVFGFLALLWGSLTSKDCNLGVESLGLPPVLIAYDMFVLLCLLFLEFSVRYLGFRFEKLHKFLGLIPKASMNWRSELCTNGVVCAACGTKIASCKDSPSERSKRNREHNVDEERERDEFEEEDLMKLKEKIAEERKLRAAALAELEKERAAASSAADEAMAKIVWLQNEKGLIEREARLYREMAEQKQIYDEAVIESSHWVIMKLEGEGPDMIKTT